ncbi:hypothetical protein D3C73_638410 [compost metagenome]
MAQAIDTVVRRGDQRVMGQALHRHRSGWLGVARFVKNHVPHDAQHFAQAFAFDRRMVAEQPIGLTGGLRYISGCGIGHDG